jgi:hypothetical protein
LNGDRQPGFLQPQVEMIQSARADIDNYFAVLRLGIRNIAEFEFPRATVRDELKGLHHRDSSAR